MGLRSEREPGGGVARRHWTTIVLEERDDGAWRATQRGVPVEGRAKTAAAAAAAYCRKVEGTDE
ncbi:hypothetical protein BRC95_11535 [Halobacteriales archaeon QS_5_68_33]|nr:MAG: hypothetical protein BRC95_11535 [Halobacteriales archaeon QS_5_68_33]